MTGMKGNRRLAALAAGVALVASTVVAASAQTGDPCAPPVANPVVCENTKPGTPQSEWDTAGGGDLSIQGFTTDISVNAGGTVVFKIDTDAADYTIDIYRMGWYGGDGARQVASVEPSAQLPQVQPDCLRQPEIGLTDCGNWAVSASWQVPDSAVSGIYFADLTRTDTGVNNHVPFVVRDDASHSDLLFQTSDTTWQAYNRYGGSSFYTSDVAPAGRAYKVSYNRPFITRKCCDEDFVFSMEYPMVRFLERNGYDVSYQSGIDTHRSGGRLLQHDVFLSVGHDEYWSGQQRANVEAARDAGVHLAFFSGNEIFWKTRYEPSTDGSATPLRTLVTYKETRANAKIDPSPEWTGTWRDPRFSPPADGGRPENRLTGTMYLVDCCAVPLRVPAADGKMRIWRNTSVADLLPGQVATMSDNTVGYEWDVDPDNGHRPPGLVRLSTTTAEVEAVLQDHGSTTAPGTATHHLTLYRDDSGALVFGAGTIQWSWGLDGTHDDSRGQESAPDQRMQQATVNLLADMGVQPATLMSGLVPATQTTDATPPTVTIASPAAGAKIPSGQVVTISGTAVDVGGRVGAVEVSTDGGATWHPASGREQWSYQWPASNAGPVTIKARAADDSANLGAAVSRDVEVRCPCSLWSTSETPEVPADADPSSIEVGTRFYAERDGFVNGMRFYKGSGNTGTHVGSLWAADGTKLAEVTFTGETATGWQEASFPEPVAISANTPYVVSYHAPSGHYAADARYFALGGRDRPPLHAYADDQGGNGVYRYGAGSVFPDRTFNGANYWVDVIFDGEAGPDTTKPTVIGRSPASGATQVPASTVVRATFSEQVDPASAQMGLADEDGAAVAGSTAYDAATRTATFTPSAPLAGGTRHVVTVREARDAAGNVMDEASWSFTTEGQQACPCTIWGGGAVPSDPDSGDPGAVEVGVRSRSDVDGWVSGVRFYKGSGNGGQHIGNLWSAAGELLATAAFEQETASGWQQVDFDHPVPVSAGTVYVASYYAPQGHYAVDPDYFGPGPHDNAPLHALANSDGGNGVFRYGTASGFPTTTYGAANYWVDLVLQTTPPPPDTTKPTVVARTPAAGATGVDPGTAVTAKLSEGVSGLQLSLETGNGTPVPATVSYDAPTRTATLTPSDGSLAFSQSYTVRASGGTDSSGNVMDPAAWTFATGEPDCPCTVFEASATPEIAAANDVNAVELGMKLRADMDGWITGVRFYKGLGNNGPHVGNLWRADGSLLASVTFTGETASGWQEASFSSPVPVTAGTTYVVSYFAPSGRYAATVDGFAAGGAGSPPLRALADGADGPNGVYRYNPTSTFPDRTFNATNYWVDAVFTPDPPA